MHIAILGWGSLIWDPRNLEIDKSEGRTGWFDDGPMLPIEFARISNDERLTLVIVPGNKDVQTLYAISKFNELDHAILDMAIREGCAKSKIGSYVKADRKFKSIFTDIQTNIEYWINSKEEIEAVIWTDLPENFQKKVKLPLTKENTINYLIQLLPHKQSLAEQYIRRAPAIVKTTIRETIEQKFGWFHIIIKSKETD